MANTQNAAPARMKSTVFHKRDSRLNDIIRRYKKSEIISLYNISTNMLFRVEEAHMQFDMLNNHRPYILFKGKAEGVFLSESTGLLFPNMCDELDFRPDKPVAASISYALSDEEIATLAGNGLFNYDWSCQGRIIGALLEIPCVTDYYAVANTPITYIEIQNRLSLKTSTRKTGYKTLVATFLPYEAQRHNQEIVPKYVEASEYNRDTSEIRKRSQYDSKAVGFKPEFEDQTKTKASFVETAQERIQRRLQEQMAKANVLGTDAERTSRQITEAVETIKSQTDKARARTALDAEGNIGRVETATLDARLNDMSTRMIYEGAQGIPVDREHISAKSLVAAKKPDENDRHMASPLTDTTLTPEMILAENEKSADGARSDINKQQSGEGSGKVEDTMPKQASADKIEDKSQGIHDSIRNSEAVAGDVAEKVLSRKEKLAQRRRNAIAAQQRIIEAGEAEAKKGLTERGKDIEILDARKAASTGGVKSDVRAKPKSDNDKADDILSEDIDIDALIDSIEK